MQPIVAVHLNSKHSPLHLKMLLPGYGAVEGGGGEWEAGGANRVR